MGLAGSGLTVTMYSLDFWAGCRLDIAVLEGQHAKRRSYNVETTGGKI